MRNEDTLNGIHGQSAHHRSDQEAASGRMTVRHAHVPTAQGEAPHAAPFLVQASAQRVIPGPDGVVTLPAGVELSDVHVVGRDLVIALPDGTQMIIVDGAVFVPELVIGTVEVPATNLAALLIDAEPKPAAGQSSSSGGNFAVPVPLLDPAAPLGDLLPPTELFYTPPEFKELGQIVNHKPSVVIDTPDQPAGAENATASVDEGALPVGSHPSSTAETTIGTIVVTSLDNPTSVSINGVDVTGGGTVIGSNGTLTITVDSSGLYHYSYTLTAVTNDNTAPHELFQVVVTDHDGDTASATLTISIVDDNPIALPDTDTVAAGTYGPEGGNVITGVGTTSGSAGADTKGADGASITKIESASHGSDTTFDEAGNLTIKGAYGTLNIDANGQYTYTRDPGTPGGVHDIFTYTLTDGDGDARTATLDINIANLPPHITFIPAVGGEETSVYESGLPARPGEPQGSNEPANSEYTTGSVSFTPGDGPVSIFINGSSTPIAVGTVVHIATGDLTITAIAGDHFDYAFHLTDNALVTGDFTDVSFAITVKDQDGQTDNGNLVIRIFDDSPTAINDSASQSPENASVTVDVFANDTAGADGVNLTSGVALVAGSLSGTGSVTYNHDGTFTYIPGSGEQGDVTFQYTITDGDGDPSTATVTIHLLQDSVPITSTATAAVDDDGLIGGNPASVVGDIDATAGSNPASSSEAVFNGTIAVNYGGDTGSISFGALDQTSGTVGTETVNYSWNAASNTLTATVSGGARDGLQLFHVVVTNPVTGAYTVTLDHNVLQTIGGNENNAVVDLTYVATDSDGDHTPGTLTITFNDDAPTVGRTESGLAPLVVDETTLAVNATQNYSGLFNVNFGADGPGGVVYSLGIKAPGGASGLVDTLTGKTVQLALLPNGDVVGFITLVPPTPGVPGSGSFAGVFTVHVDASGNVTLDQLRAVVHSDPTNTDETATLSAADLVTLTATATDADGDKASQTVNIGTSLLFHDDAPSLHIGVTDSAANILLTHDALTIGANFDVATSTGAFNSAFTVVSANYGADGPLGGNPDVNGTFALSLKVAEGTASNLTIGGVAIRLYVDANGVVTGSTATSEGLVTTANTIFTLSVSNVVDHEGEVTLTQYQQIDHPAATDPSPTGTPFADHIVALADGLVSLDVTAFITDGDHDVATDTASLDLGGNIRFADDGPVALGDTDHVNEGASTGGDVILGTGTDSGIAGKDSPGADGFAAAPNGAVIGIASINQGTSDLTTTAGNFVLAGQYGTLTLNHMWTTPAYKNPEQIF
ncbi:MAG: DUF5801 repeats-in-toxin domain-containing protein [Sphingomicrobium sp.]